MRAAGLEWLRANGPQVWTDFNNHDPGITILESVLYAMSELGYTSQLGIEQLLAGTQSFPEPEELLFTAPVTPADYSAYLMQRKSVKRASVAPLNCPDNRLFFPEGGINPPAFIGLPRDEIQLKGLYKLIVELDSSDAKDLPMGNDDVNDNVLHAFHQPVVTGPQTFFYALDFYLPYWDELPESWRNPTGFLASLATVETTDQQNVFFVTLKLTLQTGSGTPSGNTGLYVIATLEAGQAVPPLQTAELSARIKTLLEDLSPNGLLKIWGQKLRLVHRKMQDVLGHVMQTRNLCEDFQKLQLCRVQEISVRMDLRLNPGALPERTLAQIFQALDALIDPPLEAVPLPEWKASGRSPEEYMEGPPPGTALLLYPNLTSRTEARSIRASDLIHLILDLPEVAAVEDLQMSSWINGVAVASNEDDCLILLDPVLFRPRFSRSTSVVRLLSGGVNLSYSLSAVLDEEAALKAAVLPATPSVSEPPAFPEGGSPDPLYYSLQHEFPAIYRLKAGELGEDTPSLRVAQARQLKAYLLFFDQVLANGLAQASHIKDLYSLDPEETSTLPVQLPHDVDEFNLLVTSDYGNQIGSLEDDERFFRRRNNILDHLLGRYGQGPQDFTALMTLPPVQNLPALSGRNLSDIQKGLIGQKVKFLNAFPTLSAERFRSYAYASVPGLSPEELTWNTDNVSGLEKRVAVLLGLSSHKRRSANANDDNLYLVEHILLRPDPGETDPAVLLRGDISEASGITKGPDRDPYSFRVSIVLPAYHTRFMSADAKRQVEQVIALEMPAHISFDIFWAKNLVVMNQFAPVFQEWLLLKARPVPDTNPSRQQHLVQLHKAQVKMATLLSAMRALKYPQDPVSLQYELRSSPFVFDTLPPV